MQTNIPTKPAEGFVSSPAPTEHEGRQVHVHPYGIIGALHRTHHPNGTIPQEQPLTIFISLLSCLTLIFKGFALGLLLDSAVLQDQSCPPSEETAHFCSQPVQAAFPCKILTPCPPKEALNRQAGWEAQIPGPVSKGFLSRAQMPDKQLVTASVYRVYNCFGRCITE